LSTPAFVITAPIGPCAGPGDRPRGLWGVVPFGWCLSPVPGKASVSGRIIAILGVIGKVFGFVSIDLFGAAQAVGTDPGCHATLCGPAGVCPWCSGRLLLLAG
jgi:hypothetical protein